MKQKNDPTTEILSIVSELQGKIALIAGVVALLAILAYFLKYKQGDDAEKASAWKSIKSTFYAMVGFQVALWLIPYVWGKLGGPTQ